MGGMQQALVAAGSATDPTLVLDLRFDGTDGSTTIVDSSSYADSTGVCQGNAQLDTAFKDEGTASLLCDGTGDAVWFDDSTRFTLGAGDFRITLKVRFAASGTQQRIAGQAPSDGANTGSAWQIYRVTGTDLIKAEVFEGASTTYTCTSTTALGAGGSFKEIDFERIGTTLYLRINGVQESTASIGTATVNDSSSKLAVGSFGEFISGTNRTPLNGHIDKFQMWVG